MATDVAILASTEVGRRRSLPLPGRGGSSAMPHKRNPVSSTVILAAHAAAKGLVVTLLDAMAAAHERPAGAWHAEWHALPQLFGLASGALREGEGSPRASVTPPAHACQSRSHQGASLRRCRRRGARASRPRGGARPRRCGNVRTGIVRRARRGSPGRAEGHLAPATPGRRCRRASPSPRPSRRPCDRSSPEGAPQARSAPHQQAVTSCP